MKSIQDLEFRILESAAKNVDDPGAFLYTEIRYKTKGR